MCVSECVVCLIVCVLVLCKVCVLVGHNDLCFPFAAAKMTIYAVEHSKMVC